MANLDDQLQKYYQVDNKVSKATASAGRKVKSHRQSVSITGGSLAKSLKADKSRASKLVGAELAFESPDNKAKLAK